MIITVTVVNIQWESRYFCCRLTMSMFLKAGYLAIRVVVETAYNIPSDIMTNIFGEKFLKLYVQTKFWKAVIHGVNKVRITILTFQNLQAPPCMP